MHLLFHSMFQIPLPFFLHLFDSAVGADNEEEAEDPVLHDVEINLPQDEESEATDGDDSTEKKKQKSRLGASKILKKKKGFCFCLDQGRAVP